MDDFIKPETMTGGTQCSTFCCHFLLINQLKLDPNNAGTDVKTIFSPLQVASCLLLAKHRVGVLLLMSYR